jgi:hypothetical protein
LQVFNGELQGLQMKRPSLANPPYIYKQAQSAQSSHRADYAQTVDNETTLMMYRILSQQPVPDHFFENVSELHERDIAYIMEISIT